MIAVGGDAEVRDAAARHAANRRDHSADGSDFAPLLVFFGRQRVEMPEQLVRAVDEVDVHVVAGFQSGVTYPMHS